jgi:methionyl-tRNA synthetase
MISYDEFKKTELLVVTVLTAERVAKSDKLLRLLVDDGSKNEQGQILERQVIAGIGTAYEPSALVGKQIAIVANLEPRQLMGLESQGMILAAHGEPDVEGKSAPVILSPLTPVPPGSNIS